MAVDRKEANLSMLNDAHETQDKTKEAIWRIQRQANEAEEIGSQTLEELRRQGQQMDDINTELENVSTKLDTSSALQSKFDRWAGNWFGGKKNKAMKEAAAEIKLRNEEDHSKVKECFEHQHYKTLGSKWKPSGLVLCTDPNVDCSDLFDPAVQEAIENSRWVIDFSLSGIDAEGWTYATDFKHLNKSGMGTSTPSWNSSVRRRKWRYVQGELVGGNDVNDIRGRSDARKAAQGTKNQAANTSKQAEKLGYVPRNKATPLKESGLTSGGMIGRNKGAADQELDAESAAGMQKLKDNDKEIDAGIDAIAASMDRLANTASQMKDETIIQNNKLDKMDNQMSKTTEKQTVVNARQRYLLK